MIPLTMENFWSGHFFPYTESWDELQISFNLALFGLYKQAFTSLRSSLELGMLSVYYNINDEGHKTVKDWLNSKDGWDADTPRAKKIWKILKTNKNIFEFNELFNIEGSFENLNFLHNYVHTKGYKYSNRLGIIKSNCQTFEEGILLKWLNTYENIVMLIITLHMLKYPISVIEFNWHEKVGIDNPFPVLNMSEIQRIKKLLPTTHFSKIESIASNDQETQELLKHIMGIPDMTEEEQEDQLIDFDKSTIENGVGFIKWEIQERELIKRYSDESRIKALERIEILRKWAIENEMMKPKMERLKEQGFFKSE